MPMTAKDVIKNMPAFVGEKKVTYRDRDYKCVQLRQFFDPLGLWPSRSLHYEIESNRGMILVEIHSEMVESRQAVHAFLYEQFKDGHDLSFKGKVRQGGNLTVRRAYRFGTHQILIGGGMNYFDIMKKIEVAVVDLYKDYDAYLGYVEKYYSENRKIDGCQGYNQFMQKRNKK